MLDFVAIKNNITKGRGAEVVVAQPSVFHTVSAKDCNLLRNKQNTLDPSPGTVFK